MVVLVAVGLGGYVVWILWGQVNSTVFDRSDSPELDVTTTNSAKLSSELKSYVDAEAAKLAQKIDEKKCECTAAPAAAVAQTVVPKSTARETSFISMGDTYTTSLRDWVSVPGSEVYIDLVNDYTESAYVTWSVSLKVAHGNGQAFARIYDATNNIAIDGSELTTMDNVDYTQMVSGQLALWRGKNLYKLQVKSLNGFDVTASGGKIKITY